MLRIASISMISMALIIASMSFAQAHKAPIHKHTDLVPIPEYTLPYGAASAAASLKAAHKLLAGFDDAVRSKLIFDLNAKERTRWSNLPAGAVKRAGISLAEMSDDQRSLVFEFLASSLDKQGYQNVMKIMAAEAFLSQDERAKRIQWDPQNYWISFYGTPSADTPWGWAYGGHHLGLNISVKNNKVESMSPSFVGTEPAIFSYNGVDYEVVVDMHRAGYAVYQTLNDIQKKAVDAGTVPKDIITGPKADGVIPDRIGISAKEMTPASRRLLLAVIRKWVHIQPSENAELRMKQIEAELDRTNFAWTGTEIVNTPTYMRIQGPNLIIELLSTGGNVGRSAAGQGHYHTIYRNPSTEYGG